MKTKFSGIATAEVVIQRGDETLTLTLSALPLGYQELVRAAFPAPEALKFVGGISRPLAPGDPGYAQAKAAESKWYADFTDILVAKSLGDVMDTPAPVLSVGMPRETVDAYVSAVRAEWSAANLHQGDREAIVEAFNALHTSRKPGELGKS